MTQSEAERTQRQIGEAKLQLESMIDLNPAMLLLIGADGRIARANRAVLNYLGVHSFAEVLGRHPNDLFRCSVPDFFQTIASPGAKGASPRAGLFTLPDGRQRLLSIVSIPASRLGDLSGMILTDVTDEARGAAQAEELHKIEAVRALAGALMHRLNQSLTVIEVRARLMLMSLEKGELHPDEWKQALTDISELALQMADVLKRAERAEHWATETYPGGKEIVDLNRATG